MKLLDGSLVAAHYKEKIKEEVKSLISQGSKKPHCVLAKKLDLRQPCFV